MTAPRNIHGKQFEKYVNDIFTPLFTQYPSHWRRIIDSASAGNLIEATEGDFELLLPLPERGHCLGFVIECKASTEYLSLGSCFRSALRPKQVAKMRLKMRAGMFGVYLFHSVENDEIEIWPAKPLIAAHPQKRTKFFCQPAMVIQKEKLPYVAHQWVVRPLEFLEKLIRAETIPVGAPSE